MPRGTVHLVSGVIENSKRGFVLRTGDGSGWELEGGWRIDGRLRRALGQLVLVQGTRFDFNALSVERLWEAWHLPPLEEVRPRSYLPGLAVRRRPRQAWRMGRRWRFK